MRHSDQRNIQSVSKKDQKFIPNTSSINENFLNNFLFTFKSGIGGFLFVFILILFSKLLAFGIQEGNTFNIDTNDFIFSFWGFLVVSFIHFSQRFK